MENKRVWLAYATVCLSWGSTFAAVKIGISQMPPLLFSGLRFMAAGLLVFCYIALRGVHFPKEWKTVGANVGIGLLLFFGANGLMALAQQWISSSITAMMVATMPLFAALIEYLFTGRLVSLRSRVGMMIGFSGVGILMLGDTAAEIRNIWGIALLLLSNLLWAVGSVLARRISRAESMASQLAVQLTSGGGALTLVGVLAGEAGGLHVTATGLGAMAYLVGVGSLAGYGSYAYLLQHWPASRVSTYAFINPLVAVLLGTVCLQEGISLHKMLAMAVVLTGVLLAHQGRDRGLQGSTGLRQEGESV